MGVRTALLVASVGLLLLAAGCVRNSPPSPSPSGAVLKNEPPAMKADLAGANADGYVGDAVCADCHRQEFHTHHNSNHAHTLKLMEPAALGKFAPPSGSLPNCEYVLKVVNNVYYLDEEPPQGYAQKLDYAFGAGKHGQTFVSLGPDSTIMEMRASYFQSERKWLATPGLERIPSEAMGLNYNTQNSRNCFACHVTTIPAGALKPEPKFTGVGCEACHGPAGAHVKAMRSGGALTELHITRLRMLGADQVNAACERCHRTKPAQQAANPGAILARFQPSDLSRSRCFQESKNTLSCATCHNPHQNASHDRRANEAICLRCHGGLGLAVKTVMADAAGTAVRDANTMQNKGVSSASVTVVKGKVCPVNTHTDCIRCHMPPRKIMPGTQVPYTAPDHFIRVYYLHKQG